MPLGAAKPNRVDLLSCVTRSIPLNQNPESENEHVVSPVWLAHTHTHCHGPDPGPKTANRFTGTHIFDFTRLPDQKCTRWHTVVALDLLEPSWYYRVTQLTLPII